MTKVGRFLLIVCFLQVHVAFGNSEEDLQDLSGQVVPLISSGQAPSFMAGGELFARGGLTSRSDIRYSVRVKNLTGDPVVGSSLILVIEQIMEEARTRDVTSRLEILGADGQTKEGKPYYHVPTGGAEDLSPYGVSKSIQVHIRNPDLLRLAPPTFSIFGIRRTESKKLEDLREVLIQKGLLSADEATDIFGSSPPDNP